MKRYLLSSLFTLLCILSAYAHALTGLLDRIDPGASRCFLVEIKKDASGLDYFELSQKGKKPLIRANTLVNAAVGLNWYLKYYCGIHLSWNQMKAKLPESLPKVEKTVRHETDLSLRYDFNYCTFSYSMPFWDWTRWEQEIDWMALHGINMPLAAVGTECIWRNMLLRLGYSEEEVGQFIAGPAFLAWWEMNNLEGWGGPLPLSWYPQQEGLQKKILQRMKEYGMHPVLPGYSGMCPSQAQTLSSLPLKGEGGYQKKTESKVNNTNYGEEYATIDPDNSSLSGEAGKVALWNGFTRPGVLYPGDKRFDQWARLYYEEATKLFGKADYYSMDPFHEAKNLPEDLDIGEAGKEIMRTMKQYGNPNAKWVLQGWSENPRDEMIAAIEPGDLLILDLFSECRPQYGDPNSVWYRPNGYGQHDWLFCLLENFGANVGMHGRMDQLLTNYYNARRNFSTHMKGWGFTMEGSETNPVMYELLSELPWRAEKMTKEEWVKQYVSARYGTSSDPLVRAWQLLADGIYNCPWGNNQQGPSESIFCSRPSLDSYQASSWSKMTNYYDPTSTMDAARLMLQVAEDLKDNDNYRYDLVDLCRQAIADRGRIVYHQLVADFKSFDRKSFMQHKQQFLDLILSQDRLLATCPEFTVGRWLEQAKSLGHNDEEARLYEWNARVQITTWGNRYCADTGKLRDYAHKEWSGLLKDFYYPRWQHYLQILEDELNGKLPVLPIGNSSQLKNAQDNPALTVDWYAIEEPWTLQRNLYGSHPEGDAIEVAKRIMSRLFY